MVPYIENAVWKIYGVMCVIVTQAIVTINDKTMLPQLNRINLSKHMHIGSIQGNFKQDFVNFQ